MFVDPYSKALSNVFSDGVIDKTANAARMLSTYSVSSQKQSRCYNNTGSCPIIPFLLCIQFWTSIFLLILPLSICQHFHLLINKQAFFSPSSGFLCVMFLYPLRNLSPQKTLMFLIPKEQSKRQPTKWEKTLADHISERVLTDAATMENSIEKWKIELQIPATVLLGIYLKEIKTLKNIICNDLI